MLNNDKKRRWDSNMKDSNIPFESRWLHDYNEDIMVNNREHGSLYEFTALGAEIDKDNGRQALNCCNGFTASRGRISTWRRSCTSLQRDAYNAYNGVPNNHGIRRRSQPCQQYRIGCHLPQCVPFQPSTELLVRLHRRRFHMNSSVWFATSKLCPKLWAP